MTAASRRRVVRLLAALGALAAAGWLSACDALFRHTDHFVIRVDSFSAPADIGRTETLALHFNGTIGPDGSWSLSSVDERLRPGALDVTFIGARRVHTGIHYPQVPVMLDHTILGPPPIQTPFTITVHQPDGTTLQRVVVARGLALVPVAGRRRAIPLVRPEPES